MPKKKTPYNPARDVGFVAPPETADVTKLRGQQFGVDPTVAASFAEGERQLLNSYDNPGGGYMTDAMRAGDQRSRIQDLAQGKAIAMQGAANDAQQLNFNKDLAVANLTQPRAFQDPRAGQPGFGKQLALGGLSTGGSVFAGM